MIIKQEKGFSLVELMIAVVIFLFAIAAATTSFLPLVNQFKQQSKISESQIEELIGIELLRQDLEHAGYGLPWFARDADNNDDYTDDWPAYTEVDDAEAYSAYDDTGAPRGIVIGNDAGVAGNGLGINNSDYLVVKAVNVRTHDEAQKWTYIYNDIDNGIQTIYDWFDDQRDLNANTRVTIINTTVNQDIGNVLVTDAGTYSVLRSGLAASNLTPFETGEKYVVYGIGPDSSLVMPFNRADFYITDPATSTVPSRCAQNTGVLIKSTIIQDGGSAGVRTTGATAFPLLDCVADMQIILGLDIDDDGTVGTYTDGITIVSAHGQSEGAGAGDVTDTLTGADLLRNRLKEVRVYVLSHEGQLDTRYNYRNGTVTTIDVGEFGVGHVGASSFDLTTIPGYQNYRWKIYTMIVAPENLNPED